MKTDYTHIAIVLDRSGSMASIKTDTIGGFNHFLKKNQDIDLPCTFTLVQFDGQGIDTVRDFLPIQEVPALTDKTFEPRADTPLYDAIARTCLATGHKLSRMAEADRPTKVVFVIITDGNENASREFGVLQVREMLKHQQEVYKWEVVFLGANIDSHAVGAQINVARGNVMNFAANHWGIKAMYASAGENFIQYRTSRARNMAFTPADKEKQREAGAKE